MGLDVFPENFGEKQIRMTHRFPQGERKINPYWMVAGAATLLAILIIGVHRESPRTLISCHGLLHAAVSDQFVDTPSISVPPENPFFAGRPLCYYWFFHFLAAQLTRLCGMNIFHAMEALIVVSAVGMTFLSAALCRRLFNSTLTGIFMVYLILAGINPLGILYAVAKLAVYGTERLCDDPYYLWGVVHARCGLIRFNDVGGLYGPLVVHFLEISSRPVALMSLLAMVLVLERSLRRSRFVWFVLLLCTAALTTALSPIIGVSAVAALMVALVVVRPEGKSQLAQRTTAQARRVLPLASLVGLAIGVMLAAPTYYHMILGPSERQVHFWLFTLAGLRRLVTVVLSVVPLLILVYVGWRKSLPTWQPFLACLLVSAALLLLGTVAFRLPHGNESNFFHAAVVLLSIPASASIFRAVEGPRYTAPSLRRAVLIGILFVPTVLVLLSSYVGRPPVPAMFDGPRVSRRETEEDPQWAALYKWVRSETPRRAVFVLDPRSPLIAFCGNTTEFPAITGRSVFTEQLHHYLVSPYSDAERRVDLAVQLVSGEPISTSDTQYLRRLDRPLYVLLTRADQMSGIERLSRHYGPPVFRSGTLCVFRWPG
jgi:hypothetical protein